MSETTREEVARGSFSSRRVFILAAIGSAVGLGNIWRFPYVAFENGGGAFMIPYLVALLTAGIPFLLLDYAIGHRHRGSAPLSFARLTRRAEGLGWWQVGICAMIGVYYAAVLAWAGRYVFFSMNEAWGDDPEGFFYNDFLHIAKTPGVELDVVPGVLVPLLIVWAVILLILIAGVQRGIGATALVFIPVLMLTFGALVVRALFLPGAEVGLDALFTPNWGALAEPTVWAAAFGQIFFSLSIGFGIMITYASYVGRKTDMSGSALVVGFSNSGFELLAGIGVFATLGFMAQASGVAVDEVAKDGIGLAFIAFPAIISESPGGAIIGVLFFVSLVLAGITSLVSVIEVAISGVRDKFELTRVSATCIVVLPIAIASLVLFSTTSGLYVLDIIDHFINRFGILLVAVVSMLVLGWVFRSIPGLQRHLDRYGSLPLGSWWSILIKFVAPLALLFVLALELINDIRTPYEGYPTWMLALFGWGMCVAVAVIGFALARIPWRASTSMDVGDPTESEDAR